MIALSSMRIKRAFYFSVATAAIMVIALNGLFYWRTQRSSKRIVVCPESYMHAGSKHELETKRMSKDCDYIRTTELVTIILFEPDFRMAFAIQRSFPGLPVILPGDNLPTNSGSIKSVTSPKDTTSAENWNMLISACDTPYAFLALDVLYLNLSLETLQRMVRKLIENEGTQVVGGATRNITGHWRAGCYQVAMKNYVLTYTKGYHESIEECMRCDFVDGPFLAETSLLKSMTMDNQIPAKMLAPHFFLRIFDLQKSLLCPDVMFDSNDFMASASAMDKQHWKALATRWQLIRIHIRLPRYGILHKFRCSEVELKCSIEGIQLTKTLPVCCQEAFAKTVSFWDKFADDHGINYQFLSGSVLGAVKMTDMIPWDIDGDLFFDRDNFSFVRESVEDFKKAGITLKFIKEPSDGLEYTSFGCIYMQFSGFFIEMYAVPLLHKKKGETMLSDDTGPSGANPFNKTKVEIHGAWVTAPPDPGLYARGRYGKGILKHALGWKQTGKESGWDPYDPGKFKYSCGSKGHHACLDAMSVDGSIAYDVPEY